MPRAGTGTYTLPGGNPVVSGTTITSTWANDTMSDIETVLTDSLSRSGDGGMLAPLKLTNGAVGAPSLTFTSQPTSGLYLAQTGEVALSVAGALQTSFTNADTSFRSTNIPRWWNGSSYENLLSSISGKNITELNDVLTSMTPIDGQVLTFDTANGWQAESIPGGITAHDQLSGLVDDDHTQYHNDTRGDVRYYQKSQVYTQAETDALNWAAGDITSGTFDNARIAASNVTQHQAALSITESQVSDLQNYVPKNYAIKTADTSRSSTTTVTDDPHLQIAIGSTGTYAFHLVASASDGGGDLQYTFNYTGGPGIGFFLDTSTTTDDRQDLTELQSAPINGGRGAFVAHGILEATTTGTLSFQWAQQTSQGLATIVREQSYLWITKLD